MAKVDQMAAKNDKIGRLCRCIFIVQ